MAEADLWGELVGEVPVYEPAPRRKKDRKSIPPPPPPPPPCGLDTREGVVEEFRKLYGREWPREMLDEAVSDLRGQALLAGWSPEIVATCMSAAIFGSKWGYDEVEAIKVVSPPPPPPPELQRVELAKVDVAELLPGLVGKPKLSTGKSRPGLRGGIGS